MFELIPGDIAVKCDSLDEALEIVKELRKLRVPINEYAFEPPVLEENWTTWPHICFSKDPTSPEGQICRCTHLYDDSRPFIWYSPEDFVNLFKAHAPIQKLPWIKITP